MKRKHRRPTTQIGNVDSVFPSLTTRKTPIVTEPPPRRRAIWRKDSLLSDLESVRTGLIDAAEATSPEKQDEIFLGEWTIRDLIAHLIGWDKTLLAAGQEIMLGELPTFYQLRDEDWATMNLQFVQEYNRGEFADLLGAVKESHAGLVAFLDSLPEEEFNLDHGVNFEGGPVTIARLLAAEIQDEREHTAQIRNWIGAAT